MRFLAPLILPAALLLGACNASVNLSDSEKSGETTIEVRDAFIVQPPEGRDVTGGGLHVSVKGGPTTLVGARSDIAASIEMHTMSMEDNMMQMRKVDGFPVSEDAPLSLERGGNHLMLFGVQPLQVGDQVELVLTFTDESGAEAEVTTTAEIVPPAG